MEGKLLSGRENVGSAQTVFNMADPLASFVVIAVIDMQLETVSNDLKVVLE